MLNNIYSFSPLAAACGGGWGVTGYIIYKSNQHPWACVIKTTIGSVPAPLAWQRSGILDWIPVCFHSFVIVSVIVASPSASVPSIPCRASDFSPIMSRTISVNSPLLYGFLPDWRSLASVRSFVAGPKVLPSQRNLFYCPLLAKRSGIDMIGNVLPNVFFSFLGYFSTLCRAETSYYQCQIAPNTLQQCTGFCHTEIRPFWVHGSNSLV